LKKCLGAQAFAPGFVLGVFTAFLKAFIIHHNSNNNSNNNNNNNNNKFNWEMTKKLTLLQQNRRTRKKPRSITVN